MAEEAKKLRRLGRLPKRGRALPRQTEPRLTALGGHALVHTDSGWRCTVCKRSTATRLCKEVNRFLLARCDGSAACRWADQAAKAAELGSTDGGGHRRMLNTLPGGRTVLWCITCGQYAATRGVGLAQPCKGKPVKDPKGGGRWGSLAKLSAGKYPHTAERFTDLPVAEDPRVAPPVSTGIYMALDLNRRRRISRGSTSQVPVPRPNPAVNPQHIREAKASGSNGTDIRSAKEKMADDLL